VTAIAAGGESSLALKNDGTVVGWGPPGAPSTEVPDGLSGVVAIAASEYHCLALKSDGTVVGWGGYQWGQATPPAGLSGVVAIAAGVTQSLALKGDGTVVGWDVDGPMTLPASLDGKKVTAISAGSYHDLALVSDRDTTGPVLNWIGAVPADGGTYDFGDLPTAGPTCTATDDTSGVTPAGYMVSGYGTAVGTHTLTATARDNAGNTTTATRTYTVRPWTLRGFYSPVDMSGVWNTVKGGSTVPLKLEVFKGSTELTDTSVITGFTQQRAACGTGGGIEDPIEVTTTGETSLRYDTGAGQFIQNWKTPKLPGACYQVTMTTADNSALSALFKLK